MSIWTQEIDRRTLLKGAGVLGGAAALGTVDGFLIEPNWLEVTHHVVHVDGLPSTLEGYRLAQLTDVHLTGLSHIHDELVRALDTYSPQLLAVTGDLLDDRTALTDADALCDQLTRPGRTVAATLGNWEHWSGIPLTDIAKLYRRHDIELLVNQHTTTDTGVLLAGTDDGCTHRADLPKTCQNLPKADLHLLLTHAPGVLERYPTDLPTFDLTLCGHTHGGQINLFGFAPVRPPGSGRFVAGEYETEAGFTYVSRGIGMSTLPVRLMCRPELAFFEFRGR